MMIFGSVLAFELAETYPKFGLAFPAFHRHTLALVWKELESLLSLAKFWGQNPTMSGLLVAIL